MSSNTNTLPSTTSHLPFVAAGEGDLALIEAAFADGRGELEIRCLERPGWNLVILRFRREENRDAVVAHFNSLGFHRMVAQANGL